MKKVELKYRKWLRTIFGCISLTTVAFVFQACYGTYQDYPSNDLVIRGKVTDTLDTPLRDIKVSIKGVELADTTDSDGMFSIHTGGSFVYDMRFESIEPDSVSLFQSKDTVIYCNHEDKDIFFNIRLDAR